jgi:regulator of protease activity HflC (stomatin/prohibitin superfamily)
LDELLSDREKINAKLQEILDTHTDPWGIKVANVELKHIDLPVEMQRAMAKQAEAERERRAKVIMAEGEFQAATRLAEAAEIIAVTPWRCSCAICKPCAKWPAKAMQPSFPCPSICSRA